MLEKEKSIDAVTVAVPDHHHAPAAMRAMAAGKHVYVEKPLTRTVWEARQMTLAARKYGVATQMGNQGHSGDGIRRLCEMIWSGGNRDRRRSPLLDRSRQGMVDAGNDPSSRFGPSAFQFKLGQLAWPRAGAALPPPVASRTMRTEMNKSVYHPQSWRGWWDFGCGGAWRHGLPHHGLSPNGRCTSARQTPLRWFPHPNWCRRCRQ